MYVIRLKTEQSPILGRQADKCFRLINRCHNVLVKHCMHLMNRMDHDAGYKALIDAFREAKKAGAGTKDITDRMNRYRESIGLTKTGLECYIKVWQKRNSGIISSHQAQKEAARVLSGVEKILFGGGKQLHFRRLSETETICGKSPKNGISFDRSSMTFRWMGETYRLKPVDPKNSYLIQALYPGGNTPLPLSYCEIKRMMFPNGWHYYLDLYVKGTAPAKHKCGTGTAGIDPGTSTMAVVADRKAMLRELAPGTDRYTVKIKKTLRAMDRSRRASNPNNFDSSGMVRQGKLTWRCSDRYRELRRSLQTTCRKKAAYVRQSHCILANEILEAADDVIVEQMDYKALQKRSKKTERQDKTSWIKSSDGTVKQVRKFKRKKRFGRSLGSRAPSEFLTILKQKLQSIGGLYEEADTALFKASQYDHAADTYTKVPLNQRFKTIGGHRVQRDLYSAFLLRNGNAERNAADRQKCIAGFNRFLLSHDTEIQRLMTSGASMPACFGF